VPFLSGLTVVIGDAEEKLVAGISRFTDELHPGFLRGSSCLAAVAEHTGAYHIFPGMLTSPVAGNDVVQSQLSGLLAAVLAGVFITVEYLIAGQFFLPVRPFHHESEAYYGRELKAGAYRMDEAKAVFQHLRLALVNQHDGTLGPAYGERFIALVKYQNRQVYHLLDFFLSEVTSFY